VSRQLLNGKAADRVLDITFYQRDTACIKPNLIKVVQETRPKLT
jgi:hypothetical protein